MKVWVLLQPRNICYSSNYSRTQINKNVTEEFNLKIKPIMSSSLFSLSSEVAGNGTRALAEVRFPAVADSFFSRHIVQKGFEGKVRILTAPCFIPSFPNYHSLIIP